MGRSSDKTNYTRKRLHLDDEKLIELVRNNKELFDPNHQKYSDPQRRHKLWREIGCALGRSPTICKKRWSNIRDNYKKTIRKMGENLKISRYKYSYLLDFLGYTSESYGQIDNTIPVEVKAEPDVETIGEGESECCSPENTKASETDDDEMSEIESSPVEAQESASTNSKVTNNSSVESSSSRPVEREIHPVDAFLSGIAPTLKSLSPYYLSLAKTQIYSIVQEYEMAVIMERHRPGT